MLPIKFVLTGDDPASIAHFSTLLESPDVVLYEELFNRDDPAMMERHDDSGVLIKCGEDPIDFLNRVYAPQDVIATGFRLPTRQARCTSWSRLWGFLRRHVKIVQVTRNPIVSLAGLSDIVYVNPDDFRRRVDEWQFAQKDLKTYFTDADLMIVDVDHVDWELLTGFLGFSVHPPETFSTRLEERVENFAELTFLLRNTPYFKYLGVR